MEIVNLGFERKFDTIYALRKYETHRDFFMKIIFRLNFENSNIPYYAVERYQHGTLPYKNFFENKF